MRILHTSDWHLGKRLEEFSRFDEQQAVLNEICEIAENEQTDAVIIAGDLFDTFNPSAEAVDLFYKTLKRLSGDGKRAVICIAGNHDSPERIEAPDPLARECGIIFSGLPETEVAVFSIESGLKVTRSDKGFIELTLPGSVYPLRLLLTPYASELRLKKYLGSENSEEEMRSLLQARWKDLADKYCDSQGVNVLLAHLFMIKQGVPPGPEPDDERPILHPGGAEAIYTSCIPGQIRYAALGHLHRKQVMDNSPCPVVYPGSPLSYSFSEAGQDKYVIIIDAEPGTQVKTRELKLKSGKRLLRKRFELIDEAVAWLKENQESIVEITIVSETFLTAADRKRLVDAHSSILIIPEMKNPLQASDAAGLRVDLKRGINDLFFDFFKKEKGQEPGVDIMSLLNEIISKEDNP
ncbi:MAG: exonuclease subunit SbcD [Bacteroidales bacterium]